MIGLRRADAERRGMPAFKMVGVDGEAFTDYQAYLQHLVRTLPDAYRASRDFREYAGIRQRITQIEKEGAKRRSAARRTQAAVALEALGVGDIIRLVVSNAATTCPRPPLASAAPVCTPIFRAFL